MVNVVVLSPGLLGIRISGGSALETASAITLLVVSLLVVLYGSYSLLFRTTAVTPVKNIQTHEDYVAALYRYRHVKGLHKDIALALNQLDRMRKRRLALDEVLGQRFQPTELSYAKFSKVIDEVENLFYDHMRSMLNKLRVFDGGEFARFVGRHRPGRTLSAVEQEKVSLYTQYFEYMSGYLQANEEILLKLDKLLLEVAALGSTNYKEIDEMPGMQELDVLIKQTKLYKH
ncbi:hypothetical protein IDH44_06665 [Paenibacillus sp. IB182496]|uniref:Uncharacterized protein n=2 Tax=Paenibacillus sabuli TaxID=2772509 RepID=A0A927BSU0_9BACL|nr:hypothetical protein [Paenibacillus sabuli]